jgi:hypothetical protein
MGKVFPDHATTLAAIDLLVYNANILEMNVESYRRRAALDRKRGPGRPPTHATIKSLRLHRHRHFSHMTRSASSRPIRSPKVVAPSRGMAAW